MINELNKVNFPELKQNNRLSSEYAILFDYSF